MKRSAQVVLVVMSAATVGGVSYAMMPRQNCAPQNGAATGAGQQPCTSSRWSGIRTFSFFGSGNRGNSNTAPTPRTAAGIERGGFGGTNSALSRGS